MGSIPIARSTSLPAAAPNSTALPLAVAAKLVPAMVEEQPVLSGGSTVLAGKQPKPLSQGGIGVWIEGGLRRRRAADEADSRYMRACRGAGGS